MVTLNKQKKVTYAYRHNEKRYACEFGPFWKCQLYTFFEWGVEWGLRPMTALINLFWVIISGFFIYSTIYYLSSKKDKQHVEKRPIKVTFKRPSDYGLVTGNIGNNNASVSAFQKSNDLILPFNQYFNLLKTDESESYRLFKTATLIMWLSMINTTKIGWRELDIGTWLSNMHTYKIGFHTEGLIQFFIILQSLIGKLLIALLFLSLFTPFFNNW